MKKSNGFGIPWAVFVISFVFVGFSIEASAGESIQLELKIIQQQEMAVKSFLEKAAPASKMRYASYFYYLEQLRTNWTDTLNTPVQNLPENLWPMAETFRFYFAGKTNIDNPDANSLLHPPWPMNLDVSNFSSEDWRKLQIADIRVRVAWFKMVAQLQSKTFFENNPSSMIIVNGTLQHLDEMYVRKLNALLAPSDFEIISKSVDALPPFPADYVKSLAEIHAKESHGDDVFAHFDRAAFYKQITDRLPHTINGWYYSVLESNPALLEPEMRSQSVWINNLLDYFSDLLNAATKNKGSDKRVISNVQQFLGDSIRIINNANVPHAIAVKYRKLPKIAGGDFASQHFHFRGGACAVNYVSECSKVLPDLKAGSWNEAAMAVQPNDISANLTLPIAGFADYAKRGSNDEFRADLDQIRAKLEGLQDLTKSMMQQEQ